MSHCRLFHYILNLMPVRFPEGAGLSFWLEVNGLIWLSSAFLSGMSTVRCIRHSSTHPLVKRHMTLINQMALSNLQLDILCLTSVWQPLLCNSKECQPDLCRTFKCAASHFKMFILSVLTCWTIKDQFYLNLSYSHSILHDNVLLSTVKIDERYYSRKCHSHAMFSLRKETTCDKTSDQTPWSWYQIPPSKQRVCSEVVGVCFLSFMWCCVWKWTQY